VRDNLYVRSWINGLVSINGDQGRGGKAEEKYEDLDLSQRSTLKVGHEVQMNPPMLW
jgi:hypothetical protein